MVIKTMSKNQKDKLTATDSKLVFCLLDNVKDKKINYKIKTNTSFVFLSLSQKNADKIITFDMEKNTTTQIYLLDLIETSHHSYHVILNNATNSQSYLFAKLFAGKTGNVSLDVVANVKRNCVNVTTDQEIKGFLLSKDAKIVAVPSLVIDTNKIKASHSVNIGYINKDSVFYLQTKGFDYKQAVNTIIESEISILKNNFYMNKKRKIDAYKQMKWAINKMLVRSQNDR